MAHALTSVTGDAGVCGVGRLVTTQLRWHFRRQAVADVGIDAQVEAGSLRGVRAGSDPRVTTGRSAAAKQRGTYRIHKKRHLQGPQEIELARSYLLWWEVA